jgi:RND family efflux transporter MFP subunit
MNSALAALALTTLAACGSHEPAQEARETVSAPTAVVQRASQPSARVVAGTIRSATVSPLAANIVGSIVRVHVSEGDQVRAGQVLVEIDPREARAESSAASASITAAEASAKLAETTYRRYETLAERRSVSRQELDEARARRDAAQADLARVRASAVRAGTRVEYNFVRAPFDGVVTARFVDAGAQAAPGVPLLTIEDSRRMRAEATIPDDLRVRTGERVTLEVDGVTSGGVIAQIQPSVDSVSRSSLVKIDIDGSQSFRSGSFVHIRFPTGAREVLRVPPAAVIQRGQLTSVFVVDADGVARMRLVTLGQDGEVLSGLDAGERIVTSPANVRDGVKIG